MQCEGDGAFGEGNPTKEGSKPRKKTWESKTEHPERSQGEEGKLQDENRVALKMHQHKRAESGREVFRGKK